MKLKIENRTTFKTRDIRKLAIRCMKEHGINPNKHHTLTITYSKGGTSGYAYLNTGIFRISIQGSNGFAPHQTRVTEISGEAIRWVAMVMTHELQHTQGLEHKEMAKLWDTKDFHAWALEYTIGRNAPKAKKPKPKDAKENHVRALHARAVRKSEMIEKRMLTVQAELESALKQSRNLEKKWLVKVRYYDRKKAK